MIAGAVAVYASKGGRLHRDSGKVFVYTMLAMSGTGAFLASLKPERVSVVAGMLALYLVATSLLTVWDKWPPIKRWNYAAAAFGMCVVVLGSLFGLIGIREPEWEIDRQPAVVAFVFGGVALLGVIGDVQMIRKGIKGPPRIVRHLWRMCFALWIAVTSFFLGQAQVFPAPVRRFPILVTPVLVVALVLIYWWIRVRLGKQLRNGLTRIAAVLRKPHKS